MNPAELLDSLLRPGGGTVGAPDIIGLVGSALGLGFLSGFRLYATVFALGMAVRFHWFTPNETMSAMTMLADGRVLGLAAALALVEFIADKVPWVDSAWDSIHTFVRPLAAMAMAAAALGSVDPVWKTIIAILSGGVAFTAHSAKAATRFAVNHSPEPFSNWMLSTAEDLAAPLVLWFISAHPGVFLGFLAVFLGVFAYVAPRLVRMMRVQVTALGALLGRWTGVSGSAPPTTLPNAAMGSLGARELWNALHRYVDAIPAELAGRAGVGAGVRAVATKSLTGLSGSIGYLCFRESKLTFLTRRWFSMTGHSIPYHDVKSVATKTGFFMDQVIVADKQGQQFAFDIFRVTPNERTAPLPVASAASPSM